MTVAPKESSATAFIALGSNLGDRRAMISAAISALRSQQGIEVIKVSDIIETKAVGPGEQPRYLNSAAELRTSLSPRKLLDACLTIERDLGRDRTSAARWGPRTIDIDLLLFSDRVIDEPGLRVPHPHMHERRFVLTPLAQIAPTAMHPELGMTIESLLRRMANSAEIGLGANTIGP